MYEQKKGRQCVALLLYQVLRRVLVYSTAPHLIAVVVLIVVHLRQRESQNSGDPRELS